MSSTRGAEQIQGWLVGAWTVCPGCNQGTVLDAIGEALFNVGHFNCPHCGGRWTECPADGCFGYDPRCSCVGWGWVPYVPLTVRLEQAGAPAPDDCEPCRGSGESYAVTLLPTPECVYFGPCTDCNGTGKMPAPASAAVPGGGLVDSPRRPAGDVQGGGR